MSQDNHFALLMAINHYPGLQDLEGPENDATAFKTWLLDPAGGDLPQGNICLIRSADFEPGKDPPYDSSPTERQLVRALDKWLQIDREWRDKVGKRLYLFFAGHGFTAGSSISDPALFTAVAQNSDPAHIAAYRYAAKIVNAGFFDEVILVMDCCQDVLKASQVQEPTWSPPDRNQSANVKFFQAYGAPRGRKAFEDSLEGDTKKNGLFTSVWLESLRSALPDDQGWVTGQAIKTQALQIWAQRFKTRTNYDPPIRLPDGEDIRFYRRNAGSPLPQVHVDVAELAAQGGEALEVIGSSRGTKIARGQVTESTFESLSEPIKTKFMFGSKHEESLRIPPGLYSLTGSQHDRVVEVLPGIGEEPVRVMSSREIAAGSPTRSLDGGELNEVSFYSLDPGLDVVVVDANFNKVGSGPGCLKLPLEAGLYKALVTAPGAMSETWIRVDDQSTSYPLPRVQFTSSAPLEGTTTTHEYQLYPALDASQKPAEPFGGFGEIFIFARDSAHVAGGAPMLSPHPWDSLRVVSLKSNFDLPLELASRTDAANGYAFRKIAVPPGSYLVLVEEQHGTTSYETSLLVHVVAGWRTDVYLDCVDGHLSDLTNRMQTARILDTSMAAVFLTRSELPTPLLTESGRASELARLFLTTGRPAVVPQEQLAKEAPLTAILAAYANATTKSLTDEVRMERVQQCLDLLPEDIRDTFPDALILDAWLRSSDRQMPDLPPVLPSVELGWQLLQKLQQQASFNRVAVEAIGQWRLGGSVWTYTRVPVAKSHALRTKLYGIGIQDASSGTAISTFSPSWTQTAWEPAITGLRYPDPLYSPFQQALRRRVIDGIESDDPNGKTVFDLAATFGLDATSAAEAYREVFQLALQAVAKKV